MLFRSFLKESELALDISFRYFFDDNYGATTTFTQMLSFLHKKYFLQVAWTKMTLNPSKSEFFEDRIEPLGMLVGGHKTNDGVVYRLMAGNRKKDKIASYPVPTSLEEIENFLYLTIYLKALIPGRTEHARIMKEAMVRTPSGISNKVSITGFIWGPAQQSSFALIKQSIKENILIGGNPTRRYYFSVHATTTRFGAVFFQLEEADKDRLERASKGFPKGKEKVIQFISQAFADIEGRYLDIERECLAIL